jgi:hypothetical protein
VRSFSPRVTKLLFGVFIVAGSLTAAAGVIFATPQPAPAVQPTSCPGTGGPVVGKK